MNNIAIASTKIKLPSIGRPLGYRPLIDSIELFIRHRDRATYGTDTTLPDVMAAARKHGVNFMPPTPCRNHQGVFHGNKIRLYQPNVPFLKSLGKLGFPTPRSRVLTRVDVAVDLHYATIAEARSAIPAWQRGIKQKWNRHGHNIFELSAYTTDRFSRRNAVVYPRGGPTVRIEFRAQHPKVVQTLGLGNPDKLTRVDVLAIVDRCIRWQPYTADDYSRAWHDRSPAHAVSALYRSTQALFHGSKWVGFSELLEGLQVQPVSDVLVGDFVSGDR
jgi:hypothetical protein